MVIVLKGCLEGLSWGVGSSSSCTSSCLAGLAHLHLALHLVLGGGLIFILRSILSWGEGSSSSCASSCAHLVDFIFGVFIWSGRD